MYNISEITTSGAETAANVQTEAAAIAVAIGLHSPDGCFRASIVNPDWSGVVLTYAEGFAAAKWFKGCDEHGHGGEVPADALRIVARLDAALG